MALSDTVSSGVGYALNAAAFNNDAANIGDEMAGKLAEEMVNCNNVDR